MTVALDEHVGVVDAQARRAAMQQFGIYYPYVHFVNESWVKTAALYWPRMARMIPPNFVSADSSTVRQLIDDLGFVVDVDPSPCASKVSAAMEAIVRSHSAELRRQFSVRSGTGTAYLRQALDVQSAPRLPQASRLYEVSGGRGVHVTSWLWRSGCVAVGCAGCGSRRRRGRRS